MRNTITALTSITIATTMGLLTAAAAAESGRGEALAVGRAGTVTAVPLRREGVGFGAAAFIPGLGGAAPSNSILRFVNEGEAAGAVTLTLYDAASGTELGAWTSTSVPAGAGLQVTMAQVIAGASPALNTAAQSAVLNAAATATFRGDFQSLTLTGSDIQNQTLCGIDRDLGYVDGPGATTITGALRLTNPTSTAGTVTVEVYDAATGTRLGSWTSASVPAHGSITVSTTALAAAASPTVPATTAALNIVPTGATARVRLEHLAVLSGQSVASNLTSACPL